METAKELPDEDDNDPEKLLITGYETRVYGYDVKTRAQ